MKCAYCPNEVKPGQYVCEGCMEDVRARSSEAEIKARTRFCPACVPIGTACLTGGGLVRGIAHAARKALAERAA